MEKTPYGQLGSSVLTAHTPQSSCGEGRGRKYHGRATISLRPILHRSECIVPSRKSLSTPRALAATAPDSIRAELEATRARFNLVPGSDHTGVRPDGKKAERDEKKNFAQTLSDLLAVRIADSLRGDFPGILPYRDPQGGVVRGTESPARTLKGVKKLDVNFSTVQLGLGLGVSIKTLNFRDAGTGRYTKNVSRIDNELRAEAGDYHERQPFAVLSGIVFMPADAVEDGEISSFAHAALTFRFRQGRSSHRDGPELFERLYIALYEASDAERMGSVICFDTGHAPPRRGPPRTGAGRMTLSEVLADIKTAFYERNVPKKIFADSTDEGDKSAELDKLAKSDPQLFSRDDEPDE